MLARPDFHTPGELEQIEQAKVASGAPVECRRYHLEWATPKEPGDLTLVRAIFYHDGEQYKCELNG